jgi:hypothetical protein
MPGQRQYIRNDIPQVQGSPLDRRFSGQLPDPRNDVAGALGIVDYLSQRLTDIVKARVAIRQEADAGIGIIDNGGEGLIDLMGDRRGHFTHGGHPTDVRKVSLRLAQSRLGLLALNGDARKMDDSPYDTMI